MCEPLRTQTDDRWIPLSIKTIGRPIDPTEVANASRANGTGRHEGSSSGSIKTTSIQQPNAYPTAASPRRAAAAAALDTANDDWGRASSAGALGREGQYLPSVRFEPFQSGKIKQGS